MPTPEISQESVLVLYLDAKLAAAEAELRQAESFHRTSPSRYTVGRVEWCAHRTATIRELRRDAERPGQIIQRWLRVKPADRRNKP